MANNRKTTYKNAGVDIDYADSLIERVSPRIKETFRPGVLSDIGGFGGFFKINSNMYRDPVLVSSTDGVGTKLKVAMKAGIHNTIGIDLVAMCVNDIIVSGAEPLFMLDYISAGNLKAIPFEEIISGIIEGCKESNCSLLGGETAEMPGLYKKGEYDLAGFVVGVVEEEKIIDGSSVTTKDVLVGIASSGLHSNGFSLARKIFFDRKKYSLDTVLPELGVPLGEELLKPTRIYTKTILSIIKNFPVHGIAHITGGGLVGNLPRILPRGTVAVIKKGSWEPPPIFDVIQREGNVPEEEMWRTFNMGIGIVVVVNGEIGDQLVDYLSTAGEEAYIIGEVKIGDTEEKKVLIEE